MPICILLILALGCLSVGDARAQDRTQGRSVVMTRGGIVAAESPLAAQAGAAILAAAATPLMRRSPQTP